MQHDTAHKTANSLALISDTEFENILAQHQGVIRAYIASITANSPDSDDILQDTNLFLWDNRFQFAPESNFKAWALKTAYFKTLANRRDRSRRGEVEFSEAMAHRIANEAANYFSSSGYDKSSALQKCLKKLTKEDISLIQHKYLHQQSLNHYALTHGKSIQAIHKTISRIRLRLKSCIEKNSLKTNPKPDATA